MESMNELITIRQAVELSGFEYKIISGKIKRGRLPGTCKIEGIWYINKEGLQVLLEEAEKIKTSYTLQQVSEMTGESVKSLQRRVQEKNDFPGAFKLNEKWYLKKSDIDILLKENNIIDNYYTIPEASELTGISRAMIKHRLNKTDDFPAVIKIKEKWYLSKEDIEFLLNEVQDEKEILATHYTIKQASKITGIPEYSIQQKIKEKKLLNIKRFKGVWYLSQKEIDSLKRNINPKDYLTIAEASKCSGLGFETIMTEIKKGNLTDALKIDGKWCLSKDHLNDLMNEARFIKNSYTYKQAAELVGVHPAVLTKKVANDEIKAKKIRGIWYISQEEMDVLIKEKEQEKEFIRNSYTASEARFVLGMSLEKTREFFQKNNARLIGKTFYLEKCLIETYIEQKNQEYMSLEEINLVFGIDPEFIKIAIKANDISCLKISNQYLILKSDIQLLIDKYSVIKQSYSKLELEELLNCGRVKILYIMIGMSKELKKTIIYNETYFNKELVDKRIMELGGVLEFYRYYDTLYKQISDKRSNIIKQDNKDYVAMRLIPNLYGFSVSSIKTAIKKGVIKDTFITDQSVRYVLKDELDYIASILANSISIKEIKEIIDDNLEKSEYRSYKSLIKLFDEKDVFKFEMISTPHLRVRCENRKDLIEKVLRQVREKVDFKNTKNPYERYELLVKNFDDLKKKRYSFTLSVYKDYVFEQLNTTTTKKVINLVHSKYNTIEKLLSIIPSEINTLDDEVIANLFIHELMLTNDFKNLSGFLQYMQTNYPDKCKFKNKYNRKRSSKERKEEDIYTYEQWRDYTEFLTNIDLHIKNSFDNYVYARCWLYTLLHLCVDWRSQDILAIGPLTKLDLSRYTLEWFENNEFTLSEAQLIINFIKNDLDNTKAFKNQMRKHFIIYMQFVIPVAIAFISVEYHRKIYNRDTLFGVLKIESNVIVNKLGDRIKGFNNRKANRSLISYCHSTATTTEGYNNIAYSMASFLRSHKPNMYEIANTTSQYIYATNKDGDIKNISSHLFRRGIFGWLYKVIIDLANTENYENTLQLTDLIEELQENLSPYGLENLANFIENEKRNRREVINELLSTSKDDLKLIIQKLLNNELASKQHNIYCLKYERCPFPTQVKCIGCRYSIPTNYSLLTISHELIDLLDKLDATLEGDYIARQKYTYQITRLLVVLKEAKEHFDSIDKDYLKVFLDLDIIHEKFNSIKSNGNKFLYLK